MGYWFIPILFVLAVSVWWIVRWLGRDEPTREGFSGLSAVLSAVAVFTGGYWFFVERPTAAKLNIELDSNAFAYGDDSMLVIGTVRLSNVGGTTIEFDEDTKILLRLGTVLPLPPSVAGPLEAKLATDRSNVQQGLGSAGEGKVKIEPNDFIDARLWPPLANADLALGNFIEAGESDRYSFATLVPCARGQVMSLTARIPKRVSDIDRYMTGLGKRKNPVYFEQIFFSSAGVCGGERGKRDETAA